MERLASLTCQGEGGGKERGDGVPGPWKQAEDGAACDINQTSSCGVLMYKLLTEGHDEGAGTLAAAARFLDSWFE